MLKPRQNDVIKALIIFFLLIADINVYADNPMERSAHKLTIHNEKNFNLLIAQAGALQQQQKLIQNFNQQRAVQLQQYNQQRAIQQFNQQRAVQLQQYNQQRAIQQLNQQRAVQLQQYNQQRAVQQLNQQRAIQLQQHNQQRALQQFNQKRPIQNRRLGNQKFDKHHHHFRDHNKFFVTPIFPYQYYYTNPAYYTEPSVIYTNPSYDNSYVNDHYQSSTFDNSPSTTIDEIIIPEGYWIWAEGGYVPDNAVVYGNLKGNNKAVYYCQVEYNNNRYIGILIQNVGCRVNDNSNFQQFNHYQVLVH